MSSAARWILDPDMPMQRIEVPRSGLVCSECKAPIEVATLYHVEGTAQKRGLRSLRRVAVRGTISYCPVHGTGWRFRGLPPFI